MIKSKLNLNIGLTINFGVKYFSNGLQQNILFLKKLFDNIENINPTFIFTGEIPKEEFVSKNNCIRYEEFVNGEHKKFDLVILMGFWLEQEILNNIKDSNTKTKFIILQCGNQFVETSIRSIHKYEKMEYFYTSFKGIDGIWILPQHSQNISFLKTYYKTDSVSIAPYIWDSFLIDYQMKELSEKNKEDIFQSKINNVIIMEPNLSLIKNCILPIYIVENFERKFPNELLSCNIMGGKKIAYNDYFIRLLLDLDIYKKRKNFFKVHDRYKFCDSVKLFGSLLISHQLENDLNYLYFDALYLNLPIIHNSERLKKFGYYYPKNDIDQAVKEMKNVLDNHNKNLNSYQRKNKKMFEIYSIKNRQNQINYLNLIKDILKK